MEKIKKVCLLFLGIFLGVIISVPLYKVFTSDRDKSNGYTYYFEESDGSLENQDASNVDNSSNVIDDGSKDDNNSINDDNLTSNKEENILKAEPVSYFNNINNSGDKNSLKDGFVLIVDFIFYGTEINGYTFSSLTDSAKLKIIGIFLSIDKKIDEYFPYYKEKLGDIYRSAKVKAIEIYLDTASKICNDNPSFCDNVRKDFSSLRSSFGITWDFIKEMADVGIDKLKTWYELFRKQ